MQLATNRTSSHSRVHRHGHQPAPVNGPPSLTTLQCPEPLLPVAGSWADRLRLRLRLRPAAALLSPRRRCVARLMGVFIWFVCWWRRVLRPRAPLAGRRDDAVTLGAGLMIALMKRPRVIGCRCLKHLSARAHLPKCHSLSCSAR